VYQTMTRGGVQVNRESLGLLGLVALACEMSCHSVDAEEESTVGFYPLFPEDPRKKVSQNVVHWDTLVKRPTSHFEPTSCKSKEKARVLGKHQQGFERFVLVDR